MQKIKLDNLDRKILRLLQKDASLSAAAIGEKVGLSQSPCWRRIQRFKDAGLIKEQGLAGSGGEARRLVQQGAVSVDGEKVSDIEHRLPLAAAGEHVIKVGKRRFLKVVVR